MSKGRFLNQKLGKRTSRKGGLLKSRLLADRARMLKKPSAKKKKPTA